MSSALSEWQVTQMSLTFFWVRTTLPSFAGAWHVSQLFSANGGCVNLAISFGADDWCGSLHCRHFAPANGWFWCAFFKAASFGSWQSTHNAGASLVKWKRFSGVGSAP